MREMSIVLNYEKHPDGCYYVRCDSIPGFHLEGPDIDAIQRDLNPVVSDLLLHNLGFEVEHIRWVPGPDEVKQHLQRPSTRGVVTYVATLKAA
jgi:predicted RNase H-like HicB family nuclease